jgi:hypothetical protein
MKKIVLHIGAGKTGSTSIQRALFAGKKTNDNVIKYPDLGTKSSQVFRFAFCESNDTPSNIRNRFKSSIEEYRQYQQEIKNLFIEECSDSDCVIVSSEFLFLSSESEVSNIKVFLTELGFTEIHVVMYLRDPAKYYLSVAQQALKNQYLMPTPMDFRYNIDDAINNWSSINPTSLAIREFDKGRLFDGDVVKDFNQYLNSIGFYIVLELKSAQNETMSVEGTIILQEFHRVLQLSSLCQKDRNEMIQRARDFSRKASLGTKPILKPEIEDYIYQRYEALVLRLQSNYGLFTSFKREDITERQVSIDKRHFKNFSDIVTEVNLDAYLKLKDEL